ncbi:TIGR04149 family rSAM-modified RiPP [Aquimarina sp. 2201CG5-10]|nr:TIGR04149 family rSAM-modified RiPP [Aquimarina sp. 2201CG5-10]
MKKQTNKKINFKKLTIAKIDSSTMKKVRGGDCIPTEPTHDGESDMWCNGSLVP